MQSIKQGIKQIRLFSLPEKGLLFMPAVLWFSYLPNLHFGRTSGANIEVSVALLYMSMVALVGARQVWRRRANLRQQPAAWLSGAFVAWHAVSVMWTVNPLRGVLQTALLFVLWLCFLLMLSVRDARRFMAMAAQVLVAMATVMSVIAIIQVAYGAWTDWGLCAGCLARGFGFVRPSVLTIEPQFFGSLLIAPIALVVQRMLRATATRYEYVAAGVMMMALYLTLSRGALIAVTVALVVLGAVMWRYYAAPPRRIVVVVGAVCMVGCFGGMMWHALFTQLNPRVSDTWYDAVTKSVNHLSLGKIQLPKSTSPPVQSVAPSPAPASTAQPASAPQKALFDGYVQRSTDERTTLNDRAIHTWQQHPQTMLLGVGSGGAGRAMYQFDKRAGWEFEIVQNEYLSLLLELGLIGLALFTANIGYLVRLLRCEPWLMAIVAGFLVQWNFFSGLPNALHIYIIIGAMATWTLQGSEA